MPELGDDPVQPAGKFRTQLSAKHEIFAQALAKGRSQVGAHREAGYGGHTSTASKLARDPRISKRVAEIQAESFSIDARSDEIVAQKLAISKERILEHYAKAAFKELDEKHHPIGWAEKFKALEALARVLQIFRQPVDLAGNPHVEVTDDSTNVLEILIGRLNRIAARGAGRADVSSASAAMSDKYEGAVTSMTYTDGEKIRVYGNHVDAG